MKDLKADLTAGPNYGPCFTTNVRNMADCLLKWQGQIQQALDKGGNTHNFDDVAKMVLSQQAHIYDYDDCVLIMQVTEFPNFKTYHCFIGAGDLDAIERAIPEMHQVAAALECDTISISGRPGWTKAIKAHGFEHRYSTLYKKVAR